MKEVYSACHLMIIISTNMIFLLYTKPFNIIKGDSLQHNTLSFIMILNLIKVWFEISHHLDTDQVASMFTLTEL